MIWHIALFVINDVLLVCLKKAHDRYIISDCKSSCCDGISQASCCLRYIEQRSSETARVRERLDNGY